MVALAYPAGLALWKLALAVGGVTAVAAIALSEAVEGEFSDSEPDTTTKCPEAGCGSETGGDLPENPDELLDRGYTETSHPDAKAAGHRDFVNPETGDRVRFDKGKPGSPGHEGQDHYHRYNPGRTGKLDEYLDAQGKPCARGSDQSHLYPR